MIDNEQALQVLEACSKRREERRSFLRSAGCMAAVVGAAGLSACSDSNNSGGDSSGVVPPTPTPTPAPTPTPPVAAADVDVFNFALNLEYLEAQFYNFAAFGNSLPLDLLSGTGRAGAPTGARQVAFTDPAVARYAREIAGDESGHVAFIRSVLGSSAVAQPDLDLSPGGAFTAAARAAGVVPAGGTFDPYASDENFLLAAFIFEDVGVTAYKGAAPLITNKTFVEAAAGILAVEAYHAGLIRTTLYRKGLAAPALRQNTTKISDARDALDNAIDDDQGIEPVGGMSNIAPTDANGIAFSRSAGDVLNIAYLTAAAATQGGFFPNGVNGNIRTSTAG